MYVLLAVAGIVGDTECCSFDFFSHAAVGTMLRLLGVCAMDVVSQALCIRFKRDTLGRKRCVAAGGFHGDCGAELQMTAMARMLS